MASNSRRRSTRRKQPKRECPYTVEYAANNQLIYEAWSCASKFPYLEPGFAAYIEDTKALSDAAIIEFLRSSIDDVSENGTRAFSKEHPSGLRILQLIRLKYNRLSARTKRAYKRKGKDKYGDCPGGHTQEMVEDDMNSFCRLTPDGRLCYNILTKKHENRKEGLTPSIADLNSTLDESILEDILNETTQTDIIQVGRTASPTGELSPVLPTPILGTSRDLLETPSNETECRERGTKKKLNSSDKRSLTKKGEIDEVVLNSDSGNEGTEEVIVILDDVVEVLNNPEMQESTFVDENQDDQRIDEEIQIIQRKVSTVPQRDRRKFPCSICSVVFKTKRGLNDHKMSAHKRDISETEKLCETIYGIPLRGASYLCPLCVAAFEDRKRHTKHMNTHKECGNYTSFCDACSMLMLTEAEKQRHMTILGHGFALEDVPAIPVNTEIWCTECKPCLVFLTDAGYYLHVKEVHNVPIYFFCKKCFFGSCDEKLVVDHLWLGECISSVLYEKSIGFCVASDLYYQPISEENHQNAIKSDIVTPSLCAGRSMLHHGPRHGTCGEVNGDHKCFSLQSIFRYENHLSQKLNAFYDQFPKDLYPPHEYVNLEYTMYAHLRHKYNEQQPVKLEKFKKRPLVYAELPICDVPPKNRSRANENKKVVSIEERAVSEEIENLEGNGHSSTPTKKRTVLLSVQLEQPDDLQKKKSRKG